MLFAYIDETGDRGLDKGGSSPVFGMAALIVDDDSAEAVQAAVSRLRADFNVPANRVMSWKDHLKTHARRKYAAGVLGAISNVRIIYVYCQKDRVVGQYTSNRELFYNYVAIKMYKNILWAARNWKGVSEGIHTRFGHVRGHDHTSTEAYFRFQLQFDSKVPSGMERGLRWVSADQYLESQAADLYGGFLRAAIWPDEFGNVEGQYLKQIWHQIRRGSGDCPIPLGLLSMPSNDIAKNSSWYECTHCTHDRPLETSRSRST
ncbi:DUF3800 domain-containing protein [Salinibacterium sp. G-O1]|uniref:DUF3800 domain-containing protein n=1 Tax=Salinibacterium sp. G-O1 TaxID=3046208 RepID=UPI0024BA3CC2|nr:DUF3800 domain-containing protein [Salinibacterium sp. G-O1]MDJ0336443.1 DUF3800 domain-containing protein [Salinibacterium sp. G-O1]